MNSTNVFLREEKIYNEVSYREKEGDLFTLQLMEKWQKIVDIAASILDVKAGLIMKLTSTHMEVFMKSSGKDNPYPANGKDTLGHGLYCETAIGRDKLLYIENALEDENWKDNPDVKLGMISYLGYPIKYPNGGFFGTICVLDDKKMRLSEKYKEFLMILKETIEKDIIIEEERKEIEKTVMLDGLTKLNNKRSINKKLAEIDLYLDRNIGEYLITLLDIDNFKAVNDNYCHIEGDKVLITLANTLKKRVREIDFVGRFGGDEFIIISHSTKKEDFEIVMESILESFTHNQLIKSYGVSFSFGIASSIHHIKTLDMMNEADKLMYKAKTKKKQINN